MKEAQNTLKIVIFKFIHAHVVRSFGFACSCFGCFCASHGADGPGVCGKMGEGGRGFLSSILQNIGFVSASEAGVSLVCLPSLALISSALPRPSC